MTMEATPAQLELDDNRVRNFAETLLGVLNNGALSLMISIGHRTGLFDTLAGLPPATSHEIASAAGLNERYVREWLGAMTVGGVVECDRSGTLFHLPPEHAASLTRAAAADNMAVFAQYIAVLGSVEDPIVDCFARGGGVPYAEFRRFHEVMAEDSGQSVLPALLDQILPLAPGLRSELERGIDVLDVGCGRGRALNLLARTFPRSRFAGYDVSEEAIAYAKAEAAKNGTANVRFEVRDVAGLDERDVYDLVTAFDAIHDQKSPGRVLAGIARALRPGGTFLMQDISGSSHVHKNLDHPLGPMLYTISCLHCMTVSLAQGGEGLGAMWGEEKAREMLRQAGFGRIEKRNLPHDVQNNYYAVRAS
jgi:2-polyprenyl-3-methyl-5-hydroxy-6-metoxy-1,4-benzoquinol methylase